MCLQETWHRASNVSPLQNISDNYMFVDVSGVDCEKDIILGRPHCGLAIMYMRSIADKIKFIKRSNKRLCAATVELDDRPPTRKRLYSMWQLLC